MLGRYECRERRRRDRLAAQRTRLANERTLLSYERLALALGAAGVTMIHVFSADADQTIGWLLVVQGVVLAPFGLYRFIRVRSHLSKETATSST
jgi:putative membrane protein